MAKKKATANASAPNAAPSSISLFFSQFSTEQIVVGGSVLVVILALAAFGVSSFLNRPRDIEGVERIFGLERGHVDVVNYDEEGLPPAGGLHSPVWQNCGIYTQPILNENAVHSLEHGAVWITYRPDLPEDQIARLQSIARGGDFILLSPYPDLAEPIVAVAWGYRLRLDDANDSRLRDFVHNYEQGPQTPEPGAVCTRGVGNPL